MSLATRVMAVSSGACATVAGCASWPRSLKTSLTNSRLAAVLRSRPVRIFFAVIFVVAIASPAGVVVAVVWTSPPFGNGTTEAAVQADNGPVRMLPAPDVQPVGLPTPELNVYANTLSGVVSCPLCELPPRVCVPHSTAGTLDVIDPLSFKVIDHYAVGFIPHHVTPAWDMSALYVDNEGSSKLTVLDIHTGRPTGTISLPFPYNLYFSPDGTKAVDVVERLQRGEFRDPHDWHLLKAVGIPWPGADHLDFSADGSYLMISAEYSGMVARVDVVNMKLDGYVRVGGLPIDVKLSPDGRYFYVTNQGRMGVSVIDPASMSEIQFIPTGRGAHGLQVSRDTKSLYVSNRLEGSFSVIDFASRTQVAKWYIPGVGSPDMLQLNPDGTQLWASGRYNP